MQVTRKKNKKLIWKFLLQKLAGIILIAVSILLIKMVSGGTTLEDSDATGALITIPLGLYLLFTKDLLF